MTSGPPCVEADAVELAARAARLVVPGTRLLLGLAGPPAAGKSTLAAELVEALGGRAALVPLDGFHLDDRELDRLGRRERKGAADTFDAAGYVALLRRLRERADEVVWAPLFVREREHALAGALPVAREVDLVVTEGNYLLDDGGFAPVRGLLDACWWIDLSDDERRRRLVDRHVRHGRTPFEARERAIGPDERNAARIAGQRTLADLAVTVATTRRPGSPA